MEILAGLAERWLTPPVLFAIAIFLFLTLARARWAATRAGGALLATALLAGLGLGLANIHFRRLLSEPEGLSALLFSLLAPVLIWLGRHRARREEFFGREEARVEEESWSSGELVAAGAVMLLAMFLAFAFGGPLAPAHDPSAVHGDSRAPWFLLALQEAQRHFSLGPAADPAMTGNGLLRLGLLWLGLLAAGSWLLPSLDPRDETEESTERREPLFVFLFAGLVLVLAPSLASVLPRWHVEPAETVTRPLSALFWRETAPPSWLWRESPGLILLGLYFGLLPWLLLHWRPTRSLFGRYRRRLGSSLRFALAMALFLLVLYAPATLALRMLLDIDALLSVPELGLRL